MKLVGTYRGINVFSSPDCPPDAVYAINNDRFELRYPTRKDGKPDRRYSINRLMEIMTKGEA